MGGAKRRYLHECLSCVSVSLYLRVSFPRLTLRWSSELRSEADSGTLLSTLSFPTSLCGLAPEVSLPPLLVAARVIKVNLPNSLPLLEAEALSERVYPVARIPTRPLLVT